MIDGLVVDVHDARLQPVRQRQPRSGSPVSTPAVSPYRESFACRTASSSSTAAASTTGPNVSCRANSADSGTSTNTVAG